MIQLRKYHRAETEEEKQEIELSPLKVFHSAVENCKPVLITQDAKRGGVIYKVNRLLFIRASLDEWAP